MRARRTRSRMAVGRICNSTSNGIHVGTAKLEGVPFRRFLTPVSWAGLSFALSGHAARVDGPSIDSQLVLAGKSCTSLAHFTKRCGLRPDCSCPSTWVSVDAVGQTTTSHMFFSSQGSNRGRRRRSPLGCDVRPVICFSFVPRECSSCA